MRTIENLKARARALARQLGAMREGGHETDREALRKELAQVEAEIAQPAKIIPLKVARSPDMVIIVVWERGSPGGCEDGNHEDPDGDCV